MKLIIKTIYLVLIICFFAPPSITAIAAGSRGCIEEATNPQVNEHAVYKAKEAGVFHDSPWWTFEENYKGPLFIIEECYPKSVAVHKIKVVVYVNQPGYSPKQFTANKFMAGIGCDKLAQFTNYLLQCLTWTSLQGLHCVHYTFHARTALHKAVTFKIVMTNKHLPEHDTCIFIYPYFTGLQGEDLYWEDPPDIKTVNNFIKNISGSVSCEYYRYIGATIGFLVFFALYLVICPQTVSVKIRSPREIDDAQKRFADFTRDPWNWRRRNVRIYDNFQDAMEAQRTIMLYKGVDLVTEESSETPSESVKSVVHSIYAGSMSTIYEGEDSGSNSESKS